MQYGVNQFGRQMAEKAYIEVKLLVLYSLILRKHSM